jgi:uncharacterized OB-fold protein
MAATRIPMVDYLILDDGPPHLAAHECAGCGALYLDRRNACGNCSGRDFGRRDLSPTGRLRAFTIVHRAAPGVPTPYVSAIVDLDGGGVVKANLVGIDAHPEKVDPGMAVRLTTFTAGTDDDGTEAIAFGFEPVQ